MPGAPLLKPAALQLRPFSDRLIGYSPMSPSSGQSPAEAGANTNIPTAKDVTTSGGVWAPTSAKRDKVGELKVALLELREKATKETVFDVTLDDLATPEQKLDIWLVDGLHSISKTVDSEACVVDDATWKELHKWMEDMRREKDEDITQFSFEDYLKRFNREVERHLAQQTAQLSSPLLKDVRDYLDISSYLEQIESGPSQSVQSSPKQLDIAISRYRLLLVQAASSVLQESWKTITQVSDHDVDRAAVEGVSLEKEASILPLSKLETILESYYRGSASERVDAWWDFIDRDQDGVIQENEMTTVCELAIQPVGKALAQLLDEALEAHPVRLPSSGDGLIPEPKGWRQRRKETREKKRLRKMFQKTMRQHFVDEVEMAHRLRCIYAWANKAHQENSIKSIMVDEIAWTGRKRYVELPPKISLAEFREVQQEHFTHLDRVASELLKSFHEDLWVVQGNGRQTAELIRDCSIFMFVVCAVDYAIIVS